MQQQVSVSRLSAVFRLRGRIEIGIDLIYKTSSRLSLSAILSRFISIIKTSSDSVKWIHEEMHSNLSDVKLTLNDSTLI